MKRFIVPVACAVIACGGSSTLAADFFGPLRYQGFADSPFSGLSFTKFYLEDFETGALTSPGVSIVHNSPNPISLCVLKSSPITDSVDEDDGVIDGYGKDGHSFCACNATNGPTENDGYVITFDSKVLGGYPTHAGIAWTEGSAATKTVFEAFDPDGKSLGKKGPVAIGDSSYLGTTEEDRFFGVANEAGISKFIIRDPGAVNNLEVDHLQYGFVRALPHGISGTVAGLDKTVPWKVTCHNITTGEKVTVSRPKSTAQWSCNNIGLTINQGDDIQVKVRAAGLAQ